jgi:hypothetical protein
MSRYCCHAIIPVIKHKIFNIAARDGKLADNLIKRRYCYAAGSAIIGVLEDAVKEIKMSGVGTVSVLA